MLPISAPHQVLGDFMTYTMLDRNLYVMSRSVTWEMLLDTNVYCVLILSLKLEM
jgi:hypothetical protein